MYPPEILSRFQSDHRVGSWPAGTEDVGTGMVREPQHGDVMRIQVRVDPVEEIIREARFRTFGCGWAIASASLAAEWLEGRSLAEALRISADQVSGALGLPAERGHCARLAEAAVRAAIADYQDRRASAHGKVSEDHVCNH